MLRWQMPKRRSQTPLRKPSLLVSKLNDCLRVFNVRVWNHVSGTKSTNTKRYAKKHLKERWSGVTLKTDQEWLLGLKYVSVLESYLFLFFFERPERGGRWRQNSTMAQMPCFWHRLCHPLLQMTARFSPFLGGVLIPSAPTFILCCFLPWHSLSLLLGYGWWARC